MSGNREFSLKSRHIITYVAFHYRTWACPSYEIRGSSLRTTSCFSNICFANELHTCQQSPCLPHALPHSALVFAQQNCGTDPITATGTPTCSRSHCYRTKGQSTPPRICTCALTAASHRPACNEACEDNNCKYAIRLKSNKVLLALVKDREEYLRCATKDNMVDYAVTYGEFEYHPHFLSSPQHIMFIPLLENKKRPADTGIIIPCSCSLISSQQILVYKVMRILYIKNPLSFQISFI